jgi:hypothetical protein
VIDFLHYNFFKIYFLVAVFFAIGSISIAISKSTKTDDFTAFDLVILMGASIFWPVYILCVVDIFEAKLKKTIIVRRQHGKA